VSHLRVLILGVFFDNHMNKVPQLHTAKSERVVWRWISPFWILQFAGWGLLWMSYSQLIHMAKVNEPGILVGLTVNHACGLLTTGALRYLYRYWRHRRYSLGSLIWRVLPASIVTAQVWDLLVAFLSYLRTGDSDCLPNDFSEFVAILFQQSFIILAWSALYFSIRTWQDWRSEARRAEDAVRLRNTTELQMLRYQLNPHFLFNALNSIRALIEEDKESAKTVITELSEFLRYSLAHRGETTVPLREELQALHHYFSVQQIRYEERLVILWAVDSSSEDFPVLSFLLQPLVENAIKYGMQTSSMPLKIRIAAHMEQDKLFLCVSNTGAWVATRSDSGEGVGLENVQRRLENAFRNKFEFTSNEADGWVHVKISILK
jgi:two-component system, LytTR family, sensor kinase